jgi:signal peptidase I
MSRPLLTRTVGTLLGLTLLFLLVKFFVADVYRIETGSMRPTLFGGRDRPDGEVVDEHVLVRYRRGWTPERFDLVVFRDPDGGAPLVKRAVGLPGETVVIRDGDLCYGPQASRLSPHAPRPAPIPIFDQRWHDLGQFFAQRGSGEAAADGTGWRLEPSRDEALWLEFHPALRDDYLDLHHQRVEGVLEVNDAALELEIRLPEAPVGARWWLFLTEEADRFVLEAVREPQGLAIELRRESLTGSTASVPNDFQRRERLEVEPGTPVHVSLSNIDNVVRARLASGAERRVLEADYPANRSWPGSSGVPSHRGARAGFGVRGGAAHVRDVRLSRDLYYSAAGSVGTAAPVHLGPDEVFLLGDNSAVSTDGRHFGPTALEQLLGTAEAIVWPVPRRLVPAEEPW